MNIHCSPYLLPTKRRETKQRVIDQKISMLGELLENKALEC